ncbi:hypothetical protein M2175_000327 [Bradyrhizobium elkanii]|uniref:DUF4062 domain-containing protein n=1 Tax=Bradyrhizobium TaxID=374 RepID=UPI002167AA48|nr:MULTISPECIES: DUF4062 domain-containing protein [Bradyrhizobium]MCS3925296.1 hypothetical protein [Bradyrhizobium elkanii]MCS3974925.1 hypothetical protein [Bradyrhizobium japonicum]
MDRPTIFISSTIYDLGDLRSAIKDHLEINGCRVLASEFNDFTKPLDKHSYQACLDTIQQADYFLLLIGTRVGGWVDKASRVSITRKEYQTAYELAQAGRIRLLTFVRDAVWNHRQDLKELQKHLEGLAELDDSIRKKIAAYPNSMADDSETIISFIDEISRNKETSDAARGKGPMPVGNWIHTFKGFSDIRDVLDPLILRGMPVNTAAGRKALQNQLLTLLRQIVPIINSKAFMPDNSVSNFSKKLNLRADQIGGSVRIAATDWGRFATVGLLAVKDAPDASSFASALGSDLLLEYDPASGMFNQTPAYDALTELVDQLRLYAKTRTGYNPVDLLKCGLRKNSDGSVTVPTELAAGHLNMLFRWSDVANLAKALALHMDGRPLVLQKRMPITPFLDQSAKIEAEQPSLDQIRQFVGIDIAPSKSPPQP